MLKFYVSLLVLGGLISGMPQEAIADHEIIGAPKCKSCHKAKTGDQWKIWTDSAHAGAFATLASDEARKIAADQGLGDPQQEGACLKCHATRASLGADAAVSEKAKYADSEGVGCESCHGPGSDYRPKKIMTDPQAAIAAGLVMDKTAAACTRCHNEESPTFKGFDFEKRWAEIAHPVPGAEEIRSESPTANLDIPGEVLFESSVGDVLFSHKMHVEELEVVCAECHHQIHAKTFDTPHPDYLSSSWSNCQTCHNEDSASSNEYFKCSDCHVSDPDSIADETLSSKVVTHRSCWKCHESGTGVEASQGCSGCHVKKEN
jgi:hypothetical protein